MFVVKKEDVALKDEILPGHEMHSHTYTNTI